MQLYFTGQKELPNEVVEYREPTGDTSILRKFDGGMNTIKYHDMYFHLLRTPMEFADNAGKRRTLVIQIQWVNVPEGMYFLYFPPTVPQTITAPRIRRTCIMLSPIRINQSPKQNITSFMLLSL